jgi:Uma2 family endonuclease
MVPLSKRIQIVMVEPDQYAHIASAFPNVDMKYDKRAEELDLPAVMEGVTWQQYVALLDALPERYLRQAYFRGTLELREKRMEQQCTKSVINQFIGATACEFHLRMNSLGSTTRTKKTLQIGFEPDESYFVENAAAVRSFWDLGPEDGPPPDLVVETDMDHAYLDRLKVFCLLGVPEVWKYDGSDLKFYRLTVGNSYESISRSESFPFLQPDDIHRFLKEMWTTDDTTITRAFLDHARGCFGDWKLTDRNN